MRKSRERTHRTLHLVALTAVLVFGTTGHALAADDLEDVVARAGKVWYEKFCMPCHGAGGAPGDAVYSATKAPVDLRTYVARHGGKFPAPDWLALIADSRPGSVHAPVWETIRDAQGGTPQADVAARGVVGSVARYVISIQQKKK
jgi:hypothetical protein